MRRLIIPAALVLVGAVAACNSRDNRGRETARAENTVTGGAYDSITNKPGAANPSGAAGAAAGATTRATATEQALGSLLAADNLEIQGAQLAMQRAKSPAVKRLAAELQRDHQANQKKAQDLADKAHIRATPPPNAAVEQTRANDSLAMHTGAAFDSAYVRQQIEDHQKNIAALKQMESSVQDAQVKSLVASTIPVLQKHLKDAQTAEKQLGR